MYYFNVLVSWGNGLFPLLCKTVVSILENKMHYLQAKMVQVRACFSNL